MVTVAFVVAMKSIEVRSYAKINLTLEVISRRADGYHDIDSVVQVVDLADEITISAADEGVIEVITDSPEVPSGPHNLAHRACESFFAATGIRGGAICRIRKKIPVQAGLGGGSGNVAAVIAGLDRLYGTKLHLDEAARIAGEVGSDAALFAYGGTVRMRGRGEIVKPLPDAPELHLVVIKPPVGVSTAWAYAELDRTVGSERSGASDAAEVAVVRGDRLALIASMVNDFESVVLSRIPEIQAAHRALDALGAQKTMLCGSGSAVFGVFGSGDGAERAAAAAGERFAKVFVTASVARSPLEWQ